MCKYIYVILETTWKKTTTCLRHHVSLIGGLKKEELPAFDVRIYICKR